MELARLPLFGNGSLLEALVIRDPRRRNGMRHPGRAILAAAICAMLSGHRSFKAIAEWIKDQPEPVRRLLGFTSKEPPEESTIRKFLQRIDGERFAAVVGRWLQEQLEKGSPPIVAVDGKTLKGSRDGSQPAVQLVSAVTHAEGITLEQVMIEQGNEIAAVQKLLAALDLKGMIVTMDALHTQRETASLIVHVKDADYLMTVKGNQPTLLAELENAPTAAFSPSVRGNG